MNTVMPRAATGSAHHHPKSALSPIPPRAITESQKQAVVWKASASSARLWSLAAARFLARASQSMVAIDTEVSTIPTTLGSGRSYRQREWSASSPT